MVHIQVPRKVSWNHQTRSYQSREIYLAGGVKVAAAGFDSCWREAEVEYSPPGSR